MACDGAAADTTGAIIDAAPIGIMPPIGCTIPPMTGCVWDDGIIPYAAGIPAPPIGIAMLPTAGGKPAIPGMPPVGCADAGAALGTPISASRSIIPCAAGLLCTTGSGATDSPSSCANGSVL